MTKVEKLTERLFSRPKDFAWDELCKLLKNLGYEEETGGRTGGSRRRFVQRAEENGKAIILHKAHPGKILKAYQIKQIIDILKEDKT